MKISIRLFLITLLSLCSLQSPLSSELLIVKKTAEGFVPLDASDLKNSDAIAAILLTYQWPMCIASEFARERAE
ncbi:MAG: hypothetical protein WCW33_01890 [Candidatus Babeliales bacterium]